MVRHTISHHLAPTEARQLIEQAFAHYLERYPSYHPTLRWIDEQRGEIHVSVRGYKLSAGLEITPDVVIVVMSVPLLLRPFQGSAIRAIDREAARWLHKAEGQKQA